MVKIRAEKEAVELASYLIVSEQSNVLDTRKPWSQTVAQT